MKKPKSPKTPAPLARYAYYSGMGFQMIAIIGLFTYAGYRIDRSGPSDKLLWTAIFSLAGVCLSIYIVIRAATKKS